MRISDPHYVYFDVAGYGQFPFDMLRYDKCWPVNEGEIGVLRDDDTSGPRRITLGTFLRYKGQTPTFDRWRSFGWAASGYRATARSY